MAGLPLSLLAPAAAASLAYLNARFSITNDLGTLATVIGTARSTQKIIDAGRANMFYFLEEFAQSTPDHPYLVVPPPIPADGQLSVEQAKALRPLEYTYRQTYDQVLRYAAWLRNDHGVKKDDIVAIALLNKPDFIFVWFALWSLGARPAFINTSLRHEGLLHCVNLADTALLIVDEDLPDVLSEDVTTTLAAKATVPVLLDGGLKNRIATMQGHRACDDCRALADPNNMAILIYTSGTTGLPKAATITWRRFVLSTCSFSYYVGVTSSTRYYTALPLYHSSASLLGAGLCLAVGATVIISPHFSPRTFFASVLASRANAGQYIGEMCRYLVSTPPSPFDTAHELQFMFGNGIRPDIWKAFKERFNIPTICEIYAATESPTALFIKSSNNFGEGAIGRSGPVIRTLRRGYNVLVKHDVDTGEPERDPVTGLCIPVEVGEPGELVGWLDPALVKDSFGGYWKNEGATNKKLLRDVVKKGDLYFRTGDLLRGDHEGRTFFVDRIGDTFRWKGENVSTGEVEKTVAMHPAIKEANVYGVQLPKHDGRAGCAAVIFDGEPDERALRSLTDHVRKELPRYALPLFLRKVKVMAITGTNKYQKADLRTQGVDPAKVGQDGLFWLDPKGGVYKAFGEKEWQGLVGGQYKL